MLPSFSKLGEYDKIKDLRCLPPLSSVRVIWFVWFPVVTVDNIEEFPNLVFAEKSFEQKWCFSTSAFFDFKLFMACFWNPKIWARREQNRWNDVRVFAFPVPALIYSFNDRNNRNSMIDKYLALYLSIVTQQTHMKSHEQKRFGTYAFACQISMSRRYYLGESFEVFCWPWWSFSYVGENATSVDRIFLEVQLGNSVDKDLPNEV